MIADILIVIFVVLIVGLIIFFNIRAKLKGESHCSKCPYAKNCCKDKNQKSCCDEQNDDVKEENKQNK
ncbi:MAG: hypothetical protein IJW32_05300 [Clostridia bacterium]|nr:hypothetical protein [Clostridia bacterium]